MVHFIILFQKNLLHLPLFGNYFSFSAAVSARQRNKSVCIFGRSLDSSLLFAAEKVDNYLGLPDLSGEELLNQFYAHARKQGVEFVESRIEKPPSD